jgi:hypothetical protein
MLKAWGDKHTSHLGKSSQIKSLVMPQKSKFSTNQNSERNINNNNIESYRSETVFNDLTRNNNQPSEFYNYSSPPEYETRQNHVQFYQSDVENQPLPRKNHNSEI